MKRGPTVTRKPATALDLYLNRCVARVCLSLVDGCRLATPHRWVWHRPRQLSCFRCTSRPPARYIISVKPARSEATAACIGLFGGRSCSDSPCVYGLFQTYMILPSVCMRTTMRKAGVLSAGQKMVGLITVYFEALYVCQFLEQKNQKHGNRVSSRTIIFSRFYTLCVKTKG